MAADVGFRLLEPAPLSQNGSMTSSSLLPGLRLNVAAVSLAALCTALAVPTVGWAQARPVYRCPGPPVLYTDDLSAAEARQRNCRTIDGAPVTVLQAPKGASLPRPAAPAAAGPEDAKVKPAEQRARDADARRILEAELRREEGRLTDLLREFNNGEPERRADERNFQRYLDRVGEMRAAIERKQADIEAIRRELAKLGT